MYGAVVMEKYPILSRFNAPYVYFAFSCDANRRVEKLGLTYIAKIGRAGGSATAPLDRPASLNDGFHERVKGQPQDVWVRISDALLGVTDWDIILIGMFDELEWSKNVERDLHASWRRRAMGEFDVDLVRDLIKPGMRPNGINEIVRISPEWLSANCEGYDEAVLAHGGNAMAEPILQGVCDVMHDIVKDMLPKIGMRNAPRQAVPMFTATAVEAKDGAFRIHDRGALLRFDVEDDATST
jgi:hypothetical protein